MDINIALIGKPHGIKGEVTARLFTDAPELRFMSGAVFSTDSDHYPQLTIAQTRWNNERILLRFEEAPDRTAAEQLRGISLLAAERDDDSDADDGFYPHELEGLDVHVNGKPWGVVKTLELRDVQDLLIITRDGEDFYVPFVHEIVPEVDVDAGIVVVTPPPGLLDETFNSSSQEQ